MTREEQIAHWEAEAAEQAKALRLRREAEREFLVSERQRIELRVEELDRILGVPASPSGLRPCGVEPQASQAEPLVPNAWGGQ